MEIIILSIKYYFLILARVSTVLIFIPLFSNRLLPEISKIFIILVISILIMFKIGIKINNILNNNVIFIFYIIKEIIIGCIIGIIVMLPFIAMKIAGDFISFKTLFSIASVLDPTQEYRDTLWAQLYNILAIFIFLITGGINILISAIHYSFYVLPTDQIIYIKINLINELASIINNIIFIGITISLPIILSLIITEITMGIISKSMMNFNVFFIAIPLQILIALIVMIFTIDININTLKNVIKYIYQKLDMIIKLI